MTNLLVQIVTTHFGSCSVTLKTPIIETAGDKFSDNFLNFSKKGMMFNVNCQMIHIACESSDNSHGKSSLFGFSKSRNTNEKTSVGDALLLWLSFDLKSIFISLMHE